MSPVEARDEATVASTHPTRPPCLIPRSPATPGQTQQARIAPPRPPGSLQVALPGPGTGFLTLRQQNPLEREYGGLYPQWGFCKVSLSPCPDPGDGDETGLPAPGFL